MVAGASRPLLRQQKTAANAIAGAPGKNFSRMIRVE